MNNSKFFAIVSTVSLAVVALAFSAASYLAPAATPIEAEPASASHVVTVPEVLVEGEATPAEIVIEGGLTVVAPRRAKPAARKPAAQAEPSASYVAPSCRVVDFHDGNETSVRVCDDARML